ncbi:Abscisate [Carex littledalei]|uniref:Abscisate n=1 Tax=Carex littledalei TaxID=544730 RepID=A0A833QYW6_9POAL|nr:Abscisate [Carex littledalei]
MPMLIWPFAYEQFINERLLVEVIGCAGRVWDGGKRSTNEEEHELVPATAIAHAVSKIMEPGGGEYAALRFKAQNVAASAPAAVQEGGSSRGDIKNLVNDLIRFTERK